MQALSSDERANPAPNQPRSAALSLRSSTPRTHSRAARVRSGRAVAGDRRERNSA
uniref:Uncharacterized protein n=1 Tax=Aegilops tauschii subsp. strangulata TaxID=200361 RepID=A0A453PXL5_AEGTS